MNQRPNGQLEGVVKSFVAAKGFGFIDGADGRSYWFHRDQFSPPLGDIDTLDGALVVFDPTPGPKGYVAERLSLALEQATEWIIRDEFAFIRGDQPKRGRGPDWKPITPKTGALFHAYSQIIDDVTVDPKLL
jgi:cold shock CspA family protein